MKRRRKAGLWRLTNSGTNEEHKLAVPSRRTGTIFFNLRVRL